jgi:hypothetical protein
MYKVTTKYIMLLVVALLFIYMLVVTVVYEIYFQGIIFCSGLLALFISMLDLDFEE